jgi:hypothetical protein
LPDKRNLFGYEVPVTLYEQGAARLGIGGTIILGIITIIIICGLTFWITKKAYSRKWDEEE